MTKKYICIVDAFSTGAELASKFKMHGYNVIHVQSSENITTDLLDTFKPDGFDQQFIHNSNIQCLIEQLQKYEISYVIAGTETGVVLADELAAKFNLPGNNPNTSLLRRNKFEMHEALRRNGLAHAKQGYFSNAEEAISWAENQNIWPVVAKPLDSAGSDNVYFCYNIENLNKASNLILNNKNKLGLENKGILIQECLVGIQYFINAVTIDGQHAITEIWKDKRNRGICDVEELLPYEGVTQNEIISYVREVLTCLGVEQGPSHTELMFTKHGPVLIECAARMMGTILEEAVIAAIGDSHVTTTVERYVNPGKFKQRLEEGYILEKNLFCVTLVSSETGIVAETFLKEKLEKLSSFYQVFHSPNVGEKIFKTVDLFTNPGIIYLLHSDKEKIQKDYEEIRKLEKQGEFFRVESRI
ncbi:ATP-grasp domain-containing protein [Bacillus changyiensis]|uniref:ATP-grasp domain-containing protein n=1 Tax=Bacillus changyiensis TaxID=3004103 RepID=UPI0022E5EA24|nr:ATP-grasp domain-containing protein [Bacillus changyiensis]MDA1478024.1 ATP-grasp domain-containing protein [Bacillus changyiensis]